MISKYKNLDLKILNPLKIIFPILNTSSKHTIRELSRTTRKHRERETNKQVCYWISIFIIDSEINLIIL